MHPKIVESFWTDLDFEQFTGAELAARRLTFLWCFGSPITNEAGIFPLNPRAFTGDTGLTFDWLEKTMNSFPRAFLYDPASRHGLVRNYIRYQIGEGPKLMANRNMCTAIWRALRQSPPCLVQEVYRLHPELKPLPSPTLALAKGLPENASVNVPHGTNKPLPSPTQGLSKPSARSDAGSGSDAHSDAEGSVEGGGLKTAPGETHEDGTGLPGNSEVLVPSLAEVLTWGQFDGVSEEACKAFFEWHDSRGWMSGQTRIVRPRALLKRYAAGFMERSASKKTRDKAGGSSARLDTRRSADEIRADLQGERDPEKRATLQKELEAAA